MADRQRRGILLGNLAECEFRLALAGIDAAAVSGPGDGSGDIGAAGRRLVLVRRSLPCRDGTEREERIHVHEEGVGLWVAVLMPAGGTVQNLVDELCTGQVRLCRVSTAPTATVATVLCAIPLTHTARENASKMNSARV